MFMKNQNVKLILLNYLNKILEISNRGFSIKVGKKLFSANKKQFTNQTNSFILHAPRTSLIRAIKLNIFDDLLIGNFAKVIIPEHKKNNFRNIY